MINLIYSFALVMVIALIISLVARVLKQPLIISYIFAGLFIASIKFFSFKYHDIFILFSQFGITFLLFIVGLNLNPKVFREVGKTSFFAGIIQIILTAIFSFLISIKLGFTFTISLYIAAALTFSSTIIVTKILSDKQEIDSLYGKISIGVLILQDLIVLLLFILLPYLSKNLSYRPSLELILFIFSFFILLTLFSTHILTKLTKFIAKNQELLFLFSVAWCFSLVSLFYKMGLGMEMGALVAGITLSVSPYHIEISSKVKPLRDFFLIIFFINLGLELGKVNIIPLLKPALLLSTFVIFFKLLIILITLGLLGYTRRTSFFVGIHLGQISEFSFILATLGISLHHLNQNIYSMIVLVGLITIFISTYMMYYCDKIYRIVKTPLRIFEKKKRREDERKKLEFEYVLLGYNRTGFSILKSFKEITDKFVVIDYNPEVIKRLEKRKVPCIYGDAADVEMLEEINIAKAKLIVSTIPDVELGLLLIRKVRNENKKAIIIVTARQIYEALRLYEGGADYVILPHFLGGRHTSELIKQARTNRKRYEIEKKEQIKELLERIEEGHEHPYIERD